METKFTANELENLERLLGRVADIKGTEAIAVAILLGKISKLKNETTLLEIAEKKKGGTESKTEAPKKK